MPVKCDIKLHILLLFVADVVRGQDAKTVLDDPETRNRFIDQLIEVIQ